MTIIGRSQPISKLDPADLESVVRRVDPTLSFFKNAFGREGRSDDAAKKEIQINTSSLAVVSRPGLRRVRRRFRLAACSSRSLP